MMKLFEVTRDSEVLATETGEAGIENPVTIAFTVDEGDYESIEKAADFYGWDLYDVLSCVCRHGETFVSFLDSLSLENDDE